VPVHDVTVATTAMQGLAPQRLARINDSNNADPAVALGAGL
jgi:hypothetical protein